MIPIDDGGGAFGRAAEATRQAAERARAEARRAAAEAARRAAAEARRAATRDALETRPATGPFSQGSPARATPTTASASCYAPVELSRMVESGGVDSVATFPPPVGPSSGPSTALPDPLGDEAARGLVQVFDDAAAAWATLPPDLQPVVVNPDEGASAIVESWVEGGRTGIGPGDPEAYERYFERNREGLLEVAGILAPADTTPLDLYMAGDMTGYVNQFVSPALVALQRENPGASLELLAVENGSLPPRMMGMNGVAETQLVIQVTEEGQSEHFVLNPYSLFETAPINQTLAALESNPPLLDAWYQDVRGNLPGHVDQGDAAATLDYLTRMRYDNAVIEGLLDMPLEAQADFFQAYGAVDPSSGERPFGLLNRVDHIGPENVIVSVDASALVDGSAPATVNTTVNLAAIDDLGKMAAFTEQNYETLVAPTFAQYASLRGDEPRPLNGTDLINEIGTAMQLAPNNIPVDGGAIAQFESGEWNLYTGSAMEVIAPVAEAIEGLGTPPASVTTLPITYHSSETGIVQLPLFRVEGADGQERYVDNIGRTYQDFQDWRDNNELPPGRVTFPGDTGWPETLGHLAPGSEGRALTVTESTHAVVDTPLEHVVRVLDTATLVGGVVVGAALVVGTGGTALPIAAGAMATWGAARSGGELIDRGRHGQTLSLADPQARAEWLNLGASTLGIAALGSGSLARALATSGSRYAAAATGIARGLNVGAEVADVATMADLGLALTNPDLSMEQRTAIVAQLAFWGGMTAAAARTSHGSGLYGLDAAEQHLRSVGGTASPMSGPEAGEWAVRQIVDGPIQVDASVRPEVSAYLSSEYPDTVFLHFSDGDTVTVMTERQLMERTGQPDATPVEDFLFDSGLVPQGPEPLEAVSSAAGPDAAVAAATVGASAPSPPREAGVNLAMQEAFVAGMNEAGVAEIAIRASTPESYVWHGVGGGTVRDADGTVRNPSPATPLEPEIVDGRPVFPDRIDPGIGAVIPTESVSAMFPTKPGGAVTLGPAEVMALDAARASAGEPPLHEAYPDLPIPRPVPGPNGDLVWAQQLMFGGAKPVVVNPQYDGGRLVDGDIVLVVSDVDIAYAIGDDGHMLSDDEIKDTLLPAINQAYGDRNFSGQTYDIVNHGAHFNGLQDPDLRDRYRLDGEEYWTASIYKFRTDAGGFTEATDLGQAYNDLVDADYAPAWQTARAPESSPSAAMAPSWTAPQLDEVITNVEAGLPRVATLAPGDPPMFRIDNPEMVVSGIRAAHEQGMIDLPPEVFHSNSLGSGDLSRDPRHVAYIEGQIEALTAKAPLDPNGQPVVLEGLSERPIEAAGQHSDIRRFVGPDGRELYFKPLVVGEEGHGLAARGELIASRVNDMLGLESIPPTQLAWIEIDGLPVLGSVQEAISPGFIQLSPDTVGGLDTDSASFRDLQALDYLLNEKDRVPVNIFVSSDGSRVMGIDSQGVVADGPIGAPTVVPWAETRTTSGGVLPASYSEGFIETVSGLTSQTVRGQLDGWASPAEIDAFLIRLEIVRADIEAKHGVVARPGGPTTGPLAPHPGVP